MTAHAVIVNYGLISPNKAASNLSLDEGFAVVNSIVVFISIKQPISSFLRVAHLILNSVKYFSETAFLQGSFMVNRYKASVNPEFGITSPSWHGV